MPSDSSHAKSEAGKLPYSRTYPEGDCVLCTHCPSCGFSNFPPSRVCAKCLSLDVQAKPLSRQGALYSYTTLRRGDKTLFVGTVDLPEQIRLLAIIEGFDPAPTCGAAVELSRVRPLNEVNSEREPPFVFRRLAKGGMA